MSALHTLSPSEHLAEVLGPAGFLALVDAFGGTALRVHTKPQPTSKLAQALSADAYVRLQWAFAGEEIVVPKMAAMKRQRRNEKICRAYAAGATAAQLARLYDLHIVTIRDVVAKGRAASNKPGGCTELRQKTTAGASERLGNNNPDNSHEIHNS